MRFVGRFSGIVTYSDDSHDQFAAHLDERGLISFNAGVGSTPNESNTAIREVQGDATTNWLDDMLALVSATLMVSGQGTTAKTVTDATMHFSGRIARTDDTTEDFAVQYDRKAGGEFILNSSGSGSSSTGSGDVAAYSEWVGSTLTSWLESLVGTGNVVAP
jgi:hypothetical protein